MCQGRAVGAGAGTSRENAGGGRRAQHQDVQRSHPRVCSGRAAGARREAPRANACRRRGAENVKEYSMGISAYGRAGDWKNALSMLDDMLLAGVVPDVVAFTSAISACAKGGQWELA